MKDNIARFITSPWILMSILVIPGGIWLVNNLWVITNNLNKPYALAIVPVAVVSVILGWLIITFFKTIEAWCKRAYQAALKANKDNNSARFFIFVIIVFMVVSILEAGPFFNVIEHGALYGLLGYITVFAIDLIAIQSMFARLEAVRMRDEVGARIYLLGVLVCAGLSAFANGYSSLSGFQEALSGQLPAWMNTVAPWLGMGFPLLIMLLSITADYTVDRTSSKLDAQKYKEQEDKRIAVLKVRRESQQEMLQIEQDLAKIARDRKGVSKGKKERTFFLIALLFPKNPLDMQQVIESVMATITPQFQALIEQNNALQKRLDILANQSQQSQALQRQDRAIIEHQIEAIQTQRDVDMQSMMRHIEESMEAISQTPSTDEIASASNGNRQENEEIDEETKMALVDYPIVLQQLSTGVRSMTLQDIIDATGHSPQRVHKAAKNKVFRGTRRSGYYRIDSVIDWLKTVPLPKVKDGNNKPTTDEIAPTLFDANQANSVRTNGHKRITRPLDNLAPLEV